MIVHLLLLAAGCGGSTPADDVATTPAPAPLTLGNPASGDVATGSPADANPAAPPKTLIQPGTSTTQDRPEAAITAAQCGDLTDGGPINGPGCITGTIACGETVIGHTKGGGQNFDTKFYERHHCTPATTNHDGGSERIYKLEVPTGDWRVQISLDTPCADLDLAAIESASADCPQIGGAIDRCEMWPWDKTTPEKVVFSSRGGSSWFVVVEPKTIDGAQTDGAFAVHVQCQPGL